jgi:hypothetical protein
MSFNVWTLLVDVHASTPSPKPSPCEGSSVKAPPAPCPMPSITGKVFSAQARMSEREAVREQVRSTLATH